MGMGVLCVEGGSRWRASCHPWAWAGAFRLGEDRDASDQPSPSLAWRVASGLLRSEGAPPTPLRQLPGVGAQGAFMTGCSGDHPILAPSSPPQGDPAEKGGGLDREGGGGAWGLGPPGSPPSPGLRFPGRTSPKEAPGQRQ